MAIVGNTASEIGDVLLINAQTPLIGVLSLSGYTESLTGVTGSRFWLAQFSYSVDGIFFSGWLPLTATNVTAIVITSTQTLYVNYKYTRAGSDATGILGWNHTMLNGEFSLPLCQNYYVLPNSIFKDLFCNNPEQMLLCSILTQKMFDTGIMPEYVTRNQTDNPQIDDKDYLDFWGAVCCFFSLIILFGRQFEKFTTNLPLLTEYVKQRGLYFCETDIQFQDLLYLMQNFNSEISKRGTELVFINKQKLLNNGLYPGIDGEFLRLICYKYGLDEFLYSYVPEKCIGWCIGNSSPGFKTNTINTSLNKAYENTSNVVNTSLYPIYNTGSGTTTIVTEGTNTVFSAKATSSNSMAGIGGNQSSPGISDFSKAIIIDPNVDYEITLMAKQVILGANFNFGVFCFDAQNTPVNIINLNDLNTNSFFYHKTLNQANTYYFLRGILYGAKNFQSYNSGVSFAKNVIVSLGYNYYKSLAGNNLGNSLSNPTFWTHLNDQDLKTNLGGYNLWLNSNVCKIIPYVINDQTSYVSGNDLRFYDLKVKPLALGQTVNRAGINEVSYSTGFLNNRNNIALFYKNNNTKMQNDDVELILREKLINYNANFLPVRL